MPNTMAEPRSNILPDERRRLIAGRVNERGAVNSKDLAALFDVSYMTILRDIKALEQEGRVRAVRGGAIRLKDGLAAEPYFMAKRNLNQEKKQAIAALAAKSYVSDNDIIILEAGTTVAAMVKHLSQRNITIMTNGLEVIKEAAASLPTITLISSGGILRDVSYTFVGPQAVQFFQEVRANTLFLSATGLTLPDGITDPNPLETEVKRAMAASVERVVLLLDSTKFGVRSLSPVLPLDRIQVLITNEDMPEIYRNELHGLMEIVTV